MNFLAHVYLADLDDDARVGALLGDFVGTADLPRYNAVMQREILLHRKVDSYTDHHPVVVAARSLFPDGRRRYAGIALDVYYDHLLARDWARHHALPLDAFTADFYRALLARLDELPDELRRIAPLIVQHDWLGNYRHRAAVDRAVQRIATRLSRNGDKLVDCLAILRGNEAEIAQGFEVFFPQLRAYVDGLRANTDT